MVQHHICMGNTTFANASELLDHLATTGVTEDIEGKPVTFTQFFGKEEGKFVYNLVRQYGFREILELGFAQGISALYLLQGVKDNGGGRVISCDPAAHEVYKGIGLRHVQRAQLAEFHDLITFPSELVMPRLVEKGQMFDCIFIDTNHQFDQTLVEGFFADKLLKVGGFMLFDDYGLSSVKSACNFFESNRDYEVIPSNSEGLRVLRKRGMDTREWFHFVPFEVAIEDQMTWRLASMADK